MFSRIGAAALKPSLDNTLRLCGALDNPHEKFKSVHIAGTNGKGSVSHSLAAIFQKAGYKTGLYTSPHLVDFRERIRLGGNMIRKSWVVDFIERIRPVIEEVQPSFFEITVAMAFQAFAEQSMDIAVIETGLGGRLDSTNIITPELSIITNISYDHADLLGPTLPDIAREKAGIIKPSVPVVVGEWQNETAQVFKRAAAATGARLTWAEDMYAVLFQDMRLNAAQYLVQQRSTGHEYAFTSDLFGTYQTANLTTVLSAVDALQARGWNLPIDKVLDALGSVTTTTGLRGRWELLRDPPRIIADVGHNTAGLTAVLAQWAGVPAREKHIVVGFVRDKDLEAVLALFPTYAIYHFCNAAIPRALPVTELTEAAARYGLQGKSYPSVGAAIDGARAEMKMDDALLITGSFFVVGEALEAMEEAGWKA